MQDLERFVEKIIESGIGDEAESQKFKEQMIEISKNIDALEEDLFSTLTGKEKELYNKINEWNIEMEALAEKQGFYKGYLLALGFLSSAKD